MTFDVYADGKPLEIYSIQPLTMKNKDNSVGDDIGDEDAIELSQEEMVSLPRFKKRSTRFMPKRIKTLKSSSATMGRKTTL